MPKTLGLASCKYEMLTFSTLIYYYLRPKMIDSFYFPYTIKVVENLSNLNYCVYGFLGLTRPNGYVWALFSKLYCPGEGSVRTLKEFL